MLDIFANILCQQFDRSVIIQLLQTGILLIHNLTKDSSKDFLIQSAFYTELISQPFDFTDEEVVENYTSFLKGLAVNLSRSQILEIVTSKHYTLFTGAMMFFNYQDHLVKNASRTVILSILKRNLHAVNDSTVTEFIMESGFFYNIVNSVRESTSLICKTKSISLPKLEELVYDALDTIYFLNDVTQQNSEVYNRKIHEVMLYAFVLPILGSSLITDTISSHHIPIAVSLYVTSQILNIVKYQPLVKDMISIMISQYMPESYVQVMREAPCRDVFPDRCSEEITANPIYYNICQFLKCRDDNLIALTFYMLQACIHGCTPEDLVQIGILPGATEDNYCSLVSLIGETLMANMQFRFVTCSLACKVLKDLHDRAKLRSHRIEHQVIKDLLRKFIEIVSNLTKEEECEVFLNQFKDEWGFVSKVNWSEKVNLPIHFLCPSIDEGSFNIPLENRQCVNEKECKINDIRLFLMYRKAMFLMLHPLNTAYQVLPLNDGLKFELKDNELYTLNEPFFKQRTLFYVRIRDKKIAGTRILVKDDETFIIASFDDIIGKYRIEHGVNFRKISLIDRNESKVISVRLEDNRIIDIFFDDALHWLSLRNSYEKSIRNLKLADCKEIQEFIFNHNAYLD